MRVNPERVYLYCSEIDSSEAPFAHYQKLAYEALSRLDVALPETGTVLLKANATVLYPAEKRIATHPGFLAGMADALIEKGVAVERIVVGDGQSGENVERGFTWQGAGYAEMISARKMRLAEMNGMETASVPAPDGVVFSDFPIFREVTDCGFFLNVPVAKCHNLGCTTLSIKNLMGILGRPERHLCAVQEVDKPLEAELWKLTESGLSLFEDRFYHKLCDVLAAFRSLSRPRLCMVDGLIGRDGTAFNEGDNYPLGWTLIGENEVHVDAVGTYLMGLDPDVTPYLKVAAERGLGTNRLSEIEVVDMSTGEVLSRLELAALRSARVLMPVARSENGYYNRFREDGSVVPWRIDAVNKQREADDLAPVSTS